MTKPQQQSPLPLVTKEVVAELEKNDDRDLTDIPVTEIATQIIQERDQRLDIQCSECGRSTAELDSGEFMTRNCKPKGTYHTWTCSNCRNHWW